jgi:hypothetical protein
LRRRPGTKAANDFACARRFLAPNLKVPPMRPRPFAHRPAAPRCRGGASSVLRLSSVAASRWPSATELSNWVGRLAQRSDAAPAPIVAPSPEAAPWFMRLPPRAA